jgi:multidrug efflux pump subunit AcrB
MNNFFVKHKSGLSTLIFLVLLGGILHTLKCKPVSRNHLPKIKVIADAGQQPVDKMMVTVTKPLENAIKKIPNLKRFVAQPVEELRNFGICGLECEFRC